MPIFDQQGQVSGVVGISIDISERKKMEERLREAKEAAETSDKAKTVFLENMRHDIRTPMIGIIGTAGIIENQSNDPKIKHYANDVAVSSNALLSFLNEVLESIRASSGKMPLLKKKFNLKEKLDTLVQLNQAKATEKQLDFVLEYDPAIPPYIIGDPLRIQRIMLELLTNALNFTHKGYVKIQAVVAKKIGRDITLGLSVQDSGIGIPLDKHEEIYTRFKRLNPSHDSKYTSGPGLGLGIVKQFADDLDADLSLLSSPGEGAIFTCLVAVKEPLLDNEFGAEGSTMRLTCETGQEPADNTRAPAPVPERPRFVRDKVSRILLVEGHRLAAKVVENMLVGFSCQVDIATNGLAAVEQANTEHYDLIFMDIGLPDISGYEANKRIRLGDASKNTQAPIIALTAHIEAENRHLCFEAGMQRVVNKPISKEMMEDILVECLLPSAS